MLHRKLIAFYCDRPYAVIIKIRAVLNPVFENLLFFITYTTFVSLLASNHQCDVFPQLPRAFYDAYKSYKSNRLFIHHTSALTFTCSCRFLLLELHSRHPESGSTLLSAHSYQLFTA